VFRYDARMRRMHAIVTGRVQMVMFRDFSQRKARGLGIVGTVQNLSDGTVEVFALGTDDALAAYLRKLRSGSLLSRVDDVRVAYTETGNTFTDFTIIY
jgi:acylphosphatase